MSVQIERTVQYQPRNSHIESVSCTKIKHTPTTGQSYTKTSDYIEFRINPDGSYIDSSKTRLNLDFTASAKANATPVDFGLYTSPSINSAFSRLEVRVGGNILENCIDMNRIFACYSKIYASKNQLATTGSITDLYDYPTDDNKNSSAIGIKISTGADDNPPAAFATRKISVPLSLSNLFGPSAKKAFPLALIGESVYIRLYITNSVEEVIYAHAGGTNLATYTDGDFSLTNVSLEMTHIRYPQEATNAIRDGMPAEITWDGIQAISSTNTIGYSNSERIIMPNTSYSDVKNIIFNCWYPTMASNQLNMGVSCLNGSFQSQLLLDGTPISNNRPVGSNEGTNVLNSNSEYAKSILSLNRPLDNVDDTQTQIKLTSYKSATQNNYNFTVNNGGVTAVGYPYTETSVVIPTTDIFSPTVDKACAPYFGYVGFSLLTNGDPSRSNVGHNCVGRQMVYECSQTNSITTPTECRLQGILSVGVKYIVDTQSRTIRTEY